MRIHTVQSGMLHLSLWLLRKGLRAPRVTILTYRSCFLQSHTSLHTCMTGDFNAFNSPWVNDSRAFEHFPGSTTFSPSIHFREVDLFSHPFIRHFFNMSKPSKQSFLHSCYYFPNQTSLAFFSLILSHTLYLLNWPNWWPRRMCSHIVSLSLYRKVQWLPISNRQRPLPSASISCVAGRRCPKRAATIFDHLSSNSIISTFQTQYRSFYLFHTDYFHTSLVYILLYLRFTEIKN